MDIKEIIGIFFGSIIGLAILVAIFIYPPILGVVLSIFWIALAYVSEIIDREDSFDQNEIRNILSIGFACILSGIVIGVIAPFYLSTNLYLTELLRIVGAVVSLEIGLPLLLVLRLNNFAFFFGFLSTAIIFHGLMLRQVDAFRKPVLAKVFVIVCLIFASWFIGRAIFSDQKKHIPEGKEELPKDEHKAWFRYAIATLGVLLTLIEFFNIIYTLFILRR